MDDNDVIKYLEDCKKQHKSVFCKYIDPQYRDYILNRFDDSFSFSESVYRIKNKIEKHPICPVCGNLVKFKSSAAGYFHHCSTRCSTLDKEVQNKLKQTNLERYGCEYALNNIEVRNKSKQTNLERYGCKYALSNIEVRNKMKQTNLERYGCEYATQNKEIQEKQKTTNLERYGCENAFQNKEIQEKQKKTNLERYGTENYIQSTLFKQVMHNKSDEDKKLIQEKRKQTNLERYGCEYATQNKEIQEKQKKTNIERYGVEYAMQSKEVQEKMRHTNLERYGVEYVSQNVEVFDKMKQTNLEIYGCEYVFQNKSIKTKIHKSNKEHYGVEYVSQSPIIQSKIQATKRQNHTFNSSKAEDEIYQQLVNKFGKEDVKRQYSSLQYPFNCDFYIPSKDLYIECNFHWTHGGHPFNPNSTADQEQINYWQSKNSKYYNNAINVWSTKDPNKRIFAKQNHLNYIELFESTDIENFLLSV